MILFWVEVSLITFFFFPSSLPGNVRVGGGPFFPLRKKSCFCASFSRREDIVAAAVFFLSLLSFPLFILSLPHRGRSPFFSSFRVLATARALWSV